MRAELKAAAERGDMSVVQAWSGGAVGLIKSINEPAEAVVTCIVREAAERLRAAGALVVA